jgi:uncharacterized protein (DUF2236 family)
MKGYFSRESLLYRVHRERVVGVLYGQRALMIGATDPLNFVVTALHSSSKRRLFCRLARTAEAIETVIFADRAEADKILAAVYNVHRRVEGSLPVSVGRHAAGSHYSALDPGLLCWTIAVIADSAIWFFELLVETLDSSEKEELWQDYVLLGELFGLPREATPRTYVEFRHWWDERPARGGLELTEEAHQTGYAVAFQIPMPRYAARMRREHNTVMLGSLPPWVRALYGLGYTVDDKARFDRAVDSLRRLRRRSPRWLACGRSRWFYRWVTREEERRITHGRPTPELARPLELHREHPPSSLPVSDEGR